MEYGSGGGGSQSPREQDSHERRKRYHRHTANQIQRLESMFKECPHPDEKQRLHLSRELGLAPRQIKFWFQNRRTQMKAQHERADNCALRADNDKIRCENIAIREALKNVICPSCGGPPLTDDSYYDDQKLRLENAHLKEELDRVSSIAAKYIGRPISQLPPIQPILMSSLDLSMASFGNQGMVGPGPSLNLDLLPAGTSSSVPNLPYHPPCLLDMDKSLMSDIASNAMEELLRLLQTNEPLWLRSKSNAHERDILSCEAYERMFPKPNSRPKNPNVRVEASRDSGVVFMNSLALAEIFMDPNKWTELFPTFVSVAKRIQVISSGVMGGCSGSLQLMYEELQVLSPLVSTREFYFLRYCQQIEQGTWAVVDVSYDFPQDSHFAPEFRSHRRPSGCLFQDMPNGHSKVTWVEHVEIEDKTLPHRLYRNLIYSGMAFGAERWLATLQRMCERLTYLMVTSNPTRDNLGGVISSPVGKRSMMKLAQRMVTNFCASVSTSSGHRWTTLSGLNEIGVRVTVQNGVVLSAATTIWLPTPPHTVFNFFKDERKRPQWDVLSNGDVVQEVARIANGSHPGNSISVLRGLQSSENMLILQESCIDSCGSLVVYCPVDLASINIAMSGEDPSHIPLLPNGFSILPDGQGEQEGDGASTSSNSIRSGSGGSLVTIALQILVSSLPSAKLNMDSVANVNNLIGSIIHQIKASFT
ncbi:homeobox-leucine zipper protein HDG11 isoform X2 [Cajanus cajan]|uniref:Homeobox-leucine zipper protein HDG11 n=1 Tax=Cajanus cajan TaxID=3821 RepID=A0A151TK38_CAJCA|nr:homeobox-leucine zipper protein HDG11 isoform X2 [Cajanus cajan]KYP67414.1 Homeobox-leucine zipper protein HDG11 [Cajanus cajan]